MSISLHYSLRKPLSALVAREHPILALRIQTTPLPVTATRRSFHLALLLDVSGSMDGTRIFALKRTLHLLLDALNDGDALTLISYESTATVVANSVVIDSASKIDLHARIDRLVADGGTNMEEAFLALKSVHDTTTIPIDSVFLLTDGHVNQGLVSSSGLNRILTSAVDRGTPIHTLGYGSNHNNMLLRDMAIRSRGTYTFADADEMLPAIIGDISSGLATELCRQAELAIPTDWSVLKLNAVEDDTSVYTIGTLIAEKTQWVVLKGPVGATSVPSFTLTYKTSRTETHTLEAVAGSVTALEVEEQYCRTHAASVFGQVTEKLANRDIAGAKTDLAELAAFLDASVAKESVLVLRLRAQVDEILESLNAPTIHPAFPATPMRRQGAMWGGSANVDVAPILSRMASDTAALANQRGFLSHVRSAATASIQSPIPMDFTFSTPSQRNTTVIMTQQYSQVDADEPQNEQSLEELEDAIISRT